MSAAPVRTYEVRHLQLARAAVAAIAAIMITFSPDHSAAVGLAVFSGWAMVTAIILLVAVWQVYAKGDRVTTAALAIITLVAGMVAGLPALRTTTLFFVIVIAWAALTGVVELASGIRRRRTDEYARDAILIGAITLALALGLLLVNPAYSLDYFIEEAGRSFELTGITIGVGIFGGYAAIVAVFLAIAGLSPRRPVTTAADDTAADTSATAGEPA